MPALTSMGKERGTAFYNLKPRPLLEGLGWAGLGWWGLQVWFEGRQCGWCWALTLGAEALCNPKWGLMQKLLNGARKAGPYLPHPAPIPALSGQGEAVLPPCLVSSSCSHL